MNDAAPEECGKVPVRYWWRKRISWLTAAVIAITALTQAAWSFVAHRRFEAEIRRLRESGQPVLTEDLRSGVVADADNAALALRQACSALALNQSEMNIAQDLSDRWSIHEQNRSKIEPIVEKNIPALKLLREVRRRPGIAWTDPLESPTTGDRWWRPPSFNPCLQQIACLAMGLARLDGDYHEFMEILLDLLAQERVLARWPTLIANSTAEATFHLVATAIETVRPILPISATPQDFGVRPATFEQVQTLIDDLLDEAGQRDDLEWAICGERAYGAGKIHAFKRGEITLQWILGSRGLPGDGLASALAGPFVESEGLRMLKFDSAIMEAASAPNWPEAQAKLTACRLSFGGDTGFHPVVDHLTGFPNRYHRVDWHFRALAVRRMSAILLALRIYELDLGRSAGELAGLVPDYLAALPADPFDATGRTFRYQAAGPQSMIYSVGRDGIDGGGDDRGHLVGGYRDVYDIVLRLDGSDDTAASRRCDCGTAARTQSSP